jgi:hypothetical protein
MPIREAGTIRDHYEPDPKMANFCGFCETVTIWSALNTI